MRTYEITLTATVEAPEDVSLDNGEFYLDFNNNLPYVIADESVDIQELRELTE
jgi:hypothetical protein